MGRMLDVLFKHSTRIISLNVTLHNQKKQISQLNPKTVKRTHALLLLWVCAECVEALKDKLNVTGLLSPEENIRRT